MTVPAQRRRLPHGITPAWAEARPTAVKDSVLAQFGAFVLGIWYPLGSGVASSTTVGDLLLLVLVPLWWMGLRSARGGTFLLAVSGLSMASGLILTEFAKYDHKISFGIAADALMLLFGVIAGAGFLLWARDSVPIPRLGLLYGVGLLAQAAVFGQLSFDTYAWKNGLGVATAVIVLSTAALARTPRKRAVAELGGIVVLALLSVLLDSRSYLATFLLTFTLVAWQHRPRRSISRRSWVWVALFMAALAASMYQLGTSLLVNGYLGRDAQARSIEQIRQAGSLILGGRPELGASVALFEYQPTGFGAGVIANSADVRAAKIGLAQLNYDPNNGYVDKFMFGGQIELHSMLGDLWAHFGLVGLALCVTFAFLVFRGLATAVVQRSGSALIYFLCWWTLWNVFFSPFLSAAPILLPALGLVLAKKSEDPVDAMTGSVP
jgi:hypothetical protein